MNRLRRTFYINLHTTAWTGRGMSPVNKAIAALIVFCIAGVIVETEPLIYTARAELFHAIDVIVAVLFMIEYVARLWAVGEDPEYKGIIGRLKYAVTVTAIIDLVAVLPFLLGIGGTDAFLLRALRLLRIVSLAKLGRFSEALRQLGAAVAARDYELFISLAFAIFVLLASSTVMYLVEGTVQPDAFGSIPRALWWSISTLTTVGYGDVYPLTPAGKLCAGITALAAVGIIAMPTGVMAAALSDAFRHRRGPAAAPDAG